MKNMRSYRAGTGYDVHRLVPDRPLMLGGVHIPFKKGLLGHSDADVLCHAIADALLGAAGLGDIGQHFPDTDPQWAGAAGLTLLKKTGTLLALHKFEIGNIDATVIAQEPKLAPFREEIRTNIARALALFPDTVNIKFTTEEGMGFTGAGEGIAAQAACLIYIN